MSVPRSVDVDLDSDAAGDRASAVSFLDNQTSIHPGTVGWIGESSNHTKTSIVNERSGSSARSVHAPAESPDSASPKFMLSNSGHLI